MLACAAGLKKENASGLNANWFLDPLGFNSIFMRKYLVFNFFIYMPVFMYVVYTKSIESLLQNLFKCA